MEIDNQKGIYLPILDKSLCNNCTTCLKVCPGKEVDFKKLNIEVFEKEPDNILIGNYLNCYTGFSTNADIRHNSSSGGVITQILTYCLKEKIIDGVLVTRMKKSNPLEPEPFIARTTEEIIEASKSKYCPVPANIALKEIVNSKEGEKFAVVGLPCHIQGVRKAEKSNIKLKGKIVLHLGLFCNHTPSFIGTELFLERQKINGSNVADLEYRGEGHPGRMKITQNNGNINTFQLPYYWGFLGMAAFYPFRCLLCSDGICELADLSFGDAWLPEYKDNEGITLIIAKTKYAEDLLKTMRYKKYIELDKVDAHKVIQSQCVMLYTKKKSANALNKIIEKKINFNNILKTDSLDGLIVLWSYLNTKHTNNYVMRIILKKIPAKFIRLFNLPYNLLISKKALRDFKKLGYL
jgi:coenzyme F420 hydrogenase subunit beta